jgi:hypothetical protein
MLPVFSGVVLGLVIVRMQSGSLRNALLIIAGLALGFCASWMSGELGVSPWFVVVDTTQVVVAATLVAVLVKRWSTCVKWFT